MAPAFSNKLRIQNAVNFKDLIYRQLSNTRIYFTFGKETAWADDENPDQANTSTMSLNDVWNNMIGAKLLTGNEVKNSIIRNDWTLGETYNAYDDQTCDIQSDCHIVTSDWNVYKCISNNYGATSNTEPTQIFTDRCIEEVDGYIWKYMYTVTDAEQLRFVTTSYVPVQTLTEDNGSIQWNVQIEAIPGSIESIIVTNPGTNYSNANSISILIDGDGLGASAIARINAISNVISSIVIATPGSDYSYADITITDTGAGSNAHARAVISPPGGHGSDPVTELGGNVLILNPRLEDTENGKFPVDNDYRQVSLLINPKLRGTSNVAANVTYSQFMTIILNTATSSYEKDEYVYQGSTLSTSTFSAKVLSYSNNTLLLTNTEGDIQADVLIGANTRTARYVQSISEKELQEYTGNLLYIDNMIPVTRSADQAEDYKIVLKF